MTKMLTAMEKDKAEGRYVVWLRFSPSLNFKDCEKETVLEFLQGELLDY